MKTPSQVPRPRRPFSSPINHTQRKQAGRDPKAWLDQFIPFDETTLGSGQRSFVYALRRLYPECRVGNRRDTGDLCFYAINPALGFFSGLIPQDVNQRYPR